MNTNAFLVLVATARRPSPLSIMPGPAHGPPVGQVWTLLPGKNTLGREAAPDVNVCLPWFDVSRRHAVIELFASGSWEIEDLQSRNGTVVNGQKVPTRTLTPLNDGDRIRVASAELLFCFQLPAPSARSEPNESEIERWCEGALFN